MKPAFLCCFIIVFFPVRLFANPAIPLSAEISRLEGISLSQNSQSRYQAYMDLARLHRLSGNPEAALRSFAGALTVSPNDGQALLEHGRLLMSMGEYEQAAFSFSSLLAGSRDNILLTQGRYFAAKLEAFRGNTQALTALATNQDFIEYRSSIYYILWKLTEEKHWENRLITEFPHSPEARIAAEEAVLNPSPLWMLFPGRDSVQAAGQLQPQEALPPQAQAAPPPAQVPPNAVFLQTGLFSRHDNAVNRAELLRRAGFEPHIVQRQVNNSEHWAVGIYSAGDSNAAIRQLREAGFESFPVR